MFKLNEQQIKVVLVPSAKERAEKFGGKPSDYIKLFTAHAKCQIENREKETIELINRVYKKR